MTTGDWVRLLDPTEDDGDFVYVVIEDRETRMLVRAVDPVFADWTIPPVFCYATTDLVVVDRDREASAGAT